MKKKQGSKQQNLQVLHQQWNTTYQSCQEITHLQFKDKTNDRIKELLSNGFKTKKYLLKQLKLTILLGKVRKCLSLPKISQSQNKIVEKRHIHQV